MYVVYCDIPSDELNIMQCNMMLLNLLQTEDSEDCKYSVLSTSEVDAKLYGTVNNLTWTGIS